MFIGRQRQQTDVYPGSGEIPQNPRTTTAPHHGVALLVLGSLSLLICAPLGFVAWLIGSRDLLAMKSGRMDRAGESLTTVGHVLGIIGTLLFASQVFVGILWVTTVSATL